MTQLEEGRSPVVLTERTEHLGFLADALRKVARHVVVLKGGMGAGERRELGSGSRRSRVVRSESSSPPGQVSLNEGPGSLQETDRAALKMSGGIPCLRRQVKAMGREPSWRT